MKYILLISSLALILLSCNETKKVAPPQAEVKDTIVPVPVIPKMYDIPIEDYNISHNFVPSNQNISDILKRYGVSYKTSINLSQVADTIFNVRKIKAGNAYSVFQQKDSAETLSYFVYEISASEYAIFKLEDTLAVWLYNKPITITESVGKGTIETSLWNCMVANNLPPMLALELSEMYAWTIDFFGLQEGDKFTLVYTAKRVDTTFIGIEEIKYAVFNHMGQDYYAIPFMQDSVVSFFDEKGQSLRKAFLKAPLNFSRISSRFSNSRMHPVLKIRRPHHGVDYAAPIGTPIYSIGDGSVILCTDSKSAGKMVKIKHNGTYTTAYLHLSRFGKGIKVGARVTQGQVIGYVGSTGLSTGPHLDFRFYKNGQAVDPLKVEAPPVEPVKEELLKEYNVLKDSLVERLKNL